jgi:hypothetical protein
MDQTIDADFFYIKKEMKKRYLVCVDGIIYDAAGGIQVIGKTSRVRSYTFNLAADVNNWFPIGIII